MAILFVIELVGVKLKFRLAKRGRREVVCVWMGRVFMNQILGLLNEFSLIPKRDLLLAFFFLWFWLMRKRILICDFEFFKFQLFVLKFKL